MGEPHLPAALIRYVWDIAGASCACATIPGSLELLALSVASMLPKRSKLTSGESGSWRVAVVVPAHNEASSITTCVRSLSAADRGDMDVQIYVVADNCTDSTAELAEQAGATVLVRNNPVDRGKGYALHYAFTTLRRTNYDCVLVVDADTEVASDFIVTAAGAMRSGADGVQVPYLVRNRHENVRTRLMSLAMRGFNVVRPRGRDRLGLSAGILGNGFGLKQETLQAVPYLAASVVEDLEYHLSLVQAGKRIHFLDGTRVYGEAPTGGAGAKTQRSRWEGGRLRMIFLKTPKLFTGVMTGKFVFLEPLFELLLLPLAFHVILLLVALSTPLLTVKQIAAAGFAIVLLHLLAAVRAGGGPGDLWALAAAPAYVLWKLVMLPKILLSARGGHTWVRTRRNAEPHFADSGTTAGPR